jgi:hypothetical protein
MVTIINEGKILETIYFITFTIYILYNVRRYKDAKDTYVRRIPALDAVEEIVDRSVEMGRPVHISPSMKFINYQMVPALDMISHVANLCASKGCRLFATTMLPEVVPVLQDLLRIGYVKAGNPEAYNPNDVRFPTGEANAYVTAVSSLVEEENCAGNMMFGYTTGAVFVYFARARTLLKDVMQVGGTGHIGDVVHMIAGCDYFLIGDELFAASAYLNREHNLLAAMRTQDVFKLALIGLTLIGSLLAIFGSQFILTLINL